MRILGVCGTTGGPGSVCGRARVGVDVDGIVHPVTTEILSSAIDEATGPRFTRPDPSEHAGGLMDAMRASMQKMIASPVP